MFPVSMAFCQQEQSRAAKQHNSLVKRKSSEDLAAVEKHDNPDSSLVPHLGKSVFVDFSGIGDKHYAIAESILEAERAKHPHWMQQKHAQFEKEHGQLQQEDDDSGAEDQSDDEMLGQCPIDLCARDAERLDDFETWFEQIKSVLRIFRNSRKTKGFAPDHPMITISATSDVNELQGGDLVYLFGKVGFSPFDATMVKLKLERLGTVAPRALVAKMHATDEGLPDIISLDLFLKYCCETFDCEEQQVQILQYCGGRFGELDILSMESAEQASQRTASAPATVDEDVREDDRAVKNRSDLLKKVLDAGKDKQKQAKKPKGAPKPKTKGVKKKTKDESRKSKQSHCAGQDPGPADTPDVGDVRAEDPDEPGVAGAIHDTIEKEWASAFDSDLPQAPAPSQAASSSSSSATSNHPSAGPSPSPSPAQPGQPGPDNVLPWKNPQGYCFLPKDGKQMGVSLGAGLRY